MDHGSSTSLNTGRLLGLVSLGTAIGKVNPPTPVGCFVTGTLILTVAGEKPVQALKEHDVLITADGEHIPLQWMGRRTVNVRKAANPLQVQPVRIKVGALAENAPNRDLFVSSDHAFLIDGVLVPALKLINGSTIAQVEVEEVTYYHIECERHVVLVANGAAAESYLDVGNRTFFANAPSAITLHAALPVAELRASLAAPWANREQVAQIRRSLLARAETQDPGGQVEKTTAKKIA